MARGRDTILETESDSSSDESDTTAPAPAPAARWYQFGKNGLAKDDVQARTWYERGAAARDTKGVAMFGSYLLRGIGGPQNYALGLVNVTEAAGLGSEVGAYILGEAFFNGKWGLPEDPARARFWLKKVVDGECTHKQLGDKGKAKAVEWLRELDE